MSKTEWLEYSATRASGRGFDMFQGRIDVDMLEELREDQGLLADECPTRRGTSGYPCEQFFGPPWVYTVALIRCQVKLTDVHRLGISHGKVGLRIRRVVVLASTFNHLCLSDG